MSDDGADRENAREDVGDSLDPAITDPEDDPVEPDADAPLGDLAERARRSREQPPPEDEVMDSFEEVEVDGVDVEQLWEDLERDDIDDVVDEPLSDTERDVRVIPKRDYCMRCQFFSAPPEVRCTNEHGEILEMVDTEQFKVADCPILRGEAELENLRRK